MYVMIDNYDSFVYNLAIYFQEIGREVEVIRNDEIRMQYLDELDERGALAKSKQHALKDLKISLRKEDSQMNIIYRTK